MQQMQNLLAKEAIWVFASTQPAHLLQMGLVFARQKINIRLELLQIVILIVEIAHLKEIPIIMTQQKDRVIFAQIARQIMKAEDASG